MRLLAQAITSPCAQVVPQASTKKAAIAPRYQPTSPSCPSALGSSRINRFVNGIVK